MKNCGYSILHSIALETMEIFASDNSVSIRDKKPKDLNICPGSNSELLNDRGPLPLSTILNSLSGKWGKGG